MKYYHVTDFKGWIKIQKEGIKATDGQIFVFDNLEVIPSAARNQLLLEDYGIFEIDSKGITGTIENDLVGEFTAQHQFIINQDTIDDKYINSLGMKKLI